MRFPPPPSALTGSSRSSGSAAAAALLGRKRVVPSGMPPLNTPSTAGRPWRWTGIEAPTSSGHLAVPPAGAAHADICMQPLGLPPPAMTFRKSVASGSSANSSEKSEHCASGGRRRRGQRRQLSRQRRREGRPPTAAARRGAAGNPPHLILHQPAAAVAPRPNSRQRQQCEHSCEPVRLHFRILTLARVAARQRAGPTARAAGSSPFDLSTAAASLPPCMHSRLCCSAPSRRCLGPSTGSCTPSRPNVP